MITEYENNHAGPTEIGIRVSTEDVAHCDIHQPVLVQEGQWYSYSIAVKPVGGVIILDPGSIRLKAVPRVVSWKSVWSDIKKMLRV